MKALLILALPVAEIIATIWFGKLVGGWMLLLWVVMMFFVGRQIMRGASKELIPQMQQSQQGKAPDLNANFLAAVCQSLAGMLFIIPGIVTDALAILLLLPPVQKLVGGQMQTALAARGGNFMMMGGLGGLGGMPGQGQSPFGQSPFGQNPFGQSPFGRSPFDQSDVFDGEAKEVKEEVDVSKRLEKKD
jgi:UPF0716 protein FxsA